MGIANIHKLYDGNEKITRFFKQVIKNNQKMVEMRKKTIHIR